MVALKPARKNMHSALLHKEVVDKYLLEEMQEKHVVGPFYPSEVRQVQVNRFGVIPKGHQSNKWRLIIDLSHPTGASVNDGIHKQLATMEYIKIDDAIQQVLCLGPGTLLAKIDIKSAFRLIPVHPADRHLLAMEWRGGIYIDTCLPFGLRSAPKLFNILADLLEWILCEQGVPYLLHYLDDYLTMGPPNSPMCNQNLQCLFEVCGMLGIPLAVEKVEGPSPVLEFLGICIDTVNMVIRLPEEKLRRTALVVQRWLHRRNATKREILSLVGVLQHAAKVVRPGRTFVSHMYGVAAAVDEMDFYTRLNVEFRSDLYWWHLFLGNWNGICFLPLPSLPAFTIQTDASGAWGCGGYLAGEWFQFAWDQEWIAETIMAKELVPIVISCAIWGPQLYRQQVLFQCDNTGVVAAVQKGSAKEPTVTQLLRVLWFFVAYYNIHVTIEHIPGAHNTTADMLSRNIIQQFFASNPQASLLPSPVPQELAQMMSPTAPDWTSPLFKLLFTSISIKV